MYLMITESETNDYFHINVMVCVEEDGAASSAVLEETYHGNVYFPTISCQGDRFSNVIYGWSVSYNSHLMGELTLQKAEVAVKILRKIDKGLRRIEEYRGSADKFSEFVLRFAEVLKIKEFACISNLGGLRKMDASEARYCINEMERVYLARVAA